MNRGRLVAGLALIALAAAVLAGWSPLSWAGPWDSEEFSDELGGGITGIRLDDVGAGDVRVRADGRERTSVRAQVDTGWWGDAEPSFRRDGGVLVLDECRGCTVDYEIVLPAGVDVSGYTSSGNLVLFDAGAVDVESSSGDVTVRDATGRVDARSSSGEVTLVGTSGPAELQSSSGDVTVDLSRAQDVRADSSSGDVDVVVPEGRYRVEAEGADADAEVDVVDDPAAPYALVLDSSSGEVTVRTR